MENSDQTKPTTKSEPELKAFQLIQKHCAIIGIRLNSVSQPLSWKILLGFLALSVFIICQLIYAFNDAQTYAEYMQSIYTCSLLSAALLTMLVLVSERTTLYEFIEHLDEIINTSQ